MSIGVIWNPSSGEASPEVLENLQRLFRTNGLEAEFRRLEKRADVAELVREARRREFSVVAAAGGDGTVSSVATELAGTETALGVIPTGTLNHFAKDLGIPLDLEQAVRLIAKGSVTAVDVGELNGRKFVNNASLGFYPVAVRVREQHQRRGLPKWPAMARAVAFAIRRYPVWTVEFRVGEQRDSRRTPFVFIGNNEYVLQGYFLGRRTSLREGRLQLCLGRNLGRWGLVKLALTAPVGKLSDSQGLDVLTSSEAWIEVHRHRKVHVALDGEVTLMGSPLHFVSRPGSLRVVAPAGELSADARGGRH